MKKFQQVAVEGRMEGLPALFLLSSKSAVGFLAMANATVWNPAKLDT